MASDVHGDPRQFALVIPVPTVVQREQVRVVKPETVEQVANYSKPRLVEYYDDDPCAPPPPPMAMLMPSPGGGGPPMSRSRGIVTVEAAFSVAEYDIKVLSAKEGGALVDYLNANGYKMPQGAAPVVSSYLRQGMHFFVAKVNLDRMTDNPDRVPAPDPGDVSDAEIRAADPSRHGECRRAAGHAGVGADAHGPGRGDELPDGADADRHRRSGIYQRAVRRLLRRAVRSPGGGAGRRAVFLEYAWPVMANAGLCDPCTAPPLSSAVLSELGANWGDGRPGFITRLHVRYDRAHFPEDLLFQETPDTEQYQARYVIRHHLEAQVIAGCRQLASYGRELPDRLAAEQANVVGLTGWDAASVREAAAPQRERSGVR